VRYYVGREASANEQEIKHSWDNASFRISKLVMDYINTQKEEDWLNIIYLPKKAPYLNPNERKVNQRRFVPLL